MNENKVLAFIDEFLNKEGQENVETIRHLFRSGYCLHFAEMLKSTFQRGEVCWCAPFGHMVWMDEDGTPYDIEGINYSDCDYYIPINYIKEGLNDFRHIPGVEFNASQEYIDNAIEKYKKDKHIDEIVEVYSEYEFIDDVYTKGE